jgi:hypothetical protein
MGKKKGECECALALVYIKNGIPAQHGLALMLQICTFFVKAHASHHACTIHPHVMRA